MSNHHASRDALTDVTRWRGQADRFRSVFARSLYPMLLADSERRYVDANRPAALLLRLPRAAICALRVDDIVPPERRATLPQTWAEFLKTGSTAGIYEVALPDGARMELMFSSTANILPGVHLAVLHPLDWDDDRAPSTSVPLELPNGEISTRQAQVLSLIALGASIEEVASELGLSLHTVRSHLRNASKKLGAVNRPHAIAIALREGLIDT